MREIAVLAVAIFVSFLAFSPAAAAAEEPELEEMKGAVLAAGGDWGAIEEMLATGKAKGGDTALLLGFGAGLSYAGAVVTLPPAPKISSFDTLDEQPVGKLATHLAAIDEA